MFTDVFIKKLLKKFAKFTRSQLKGLLRNRLTEVGKIIFRKRAWFRLKNFTQWSDFLYSQWFLKRQLRNCDRRVSLTFMLFFFVKNDRIAISVPIIWSINQWSFYHLKKCRRDNQIYMSQLVTSLFPTNYYSKSKKLIWDSVKPWI